MPHIALNSAEPGIRGLLRYRPETAGPLSELTEVLLRGPGTLPRGERELIAAYVSALNDCRYCSASHAACAAAQSAPSAVFTMWSARIGAPLAALPSSGCIPEHGDRRTGGDRRWQSRNTLAPPPGFAGTSSPSAPGP